MRKAALLVLNSVAHNKPAVREQLPELMPMLFAETRKKAELIHQVDLGPFKHTVDDGLSCARLPLNAWTPSWITAQTASSSQPSSHASQTGCATTTTLR